MSIGKHQADAGKTIDWLKLSGQFRDFRAQSRCGLAEIARVTGIPVQQLAWLEGGLVRPLESAAELHRLIPRLETLLSQADDKKENFVPPFLRS
jgi:transcriptional regulator with XRE-family HTH domain